MIILWRNWKLVYHLIFLPFLVSILWSRQALETWYSELSACRLFLTAVAISIVSFASFLAHSDVSVFLPFVWLEFNCFSSIVNRDQKGSGVFSYHIDFNSGVESLLSCSVYIRWWAPLPSSLGHHISASLVDHISSVWNCIARLRHGFGHGGWRAIVGVWSLAFK